jgi:hypothetical protein
LTSQPTFSATTADAYARPGLQYGVTLASADQQMVNMSESLLADLSKEAPGGGGGLLVSPFTIGFRLKSATQ